MQNELSEVPRLMQEWRDGGKHDWRKLLQARAALLDSCEEILQASTNESRGLTPEEKRSFDERAAEVREINAELSKHKAARVAEHGADLVHLPF